MAEEQKNFEFTIRDGEDFIELIALLKYLGIAPTGGQAKLMVENSQAWWAAPFNRERGAKFVQE